MQDAVLPQGEPRDAAVISVGIEFYSCPARFSLRLHDFQITANSAVKYRVGQKDYTRLFF